MAMEIVDFPINSMVDLSVVFCMFTRGYMGDFQKCLVCFMENHLEMDDLNVVPWLRKPPYDADMEMDHFRSDLGDHRLKCLCFVLTRDFFWVPKFDPYPYHLQREKMWKVPKLWKIFENTMWFTNFCWKKQGVIFVCSYLRGPVCVGPGTKNIYIYMYIYYMW